MNPDELIPAIPPEDYEGQISDWMLALQNYGLWDGENPEWYGELKIPRKLWQDILSDCEP
jgi:hypothetical protein